MVVAALLACTLFFLAVMAFMFAFSPRFHPRGGAYHLTSLVFVIWMVACVILTPYTFALKVGGLPDISIDRVLLVLLMACVGLRAFRKDLVHGQGKLIEFLMLVFCGICLVSMARFGFMEIYSEFARPSYIFQTGYLIPFLSFFVAKYFLSSEEDILIVFRIFFWFGCYLVLLAFLEHYGLKRFVFPSYIVDPSVSDLHLDRARGPFLNAAFNGLALNFAFICGLFVLPTVKGPKRLPYILLLLAYAPAIYFTRTRSVYLHFLVTVLAVLFLYRTKTSWWRLLPVLFLVAAIVVGANLHKLTSSSRESGGLGEMKEIYIRFGLAEKSRNMILENPISGVGLAQFRTGSLFMPSEVEYQHNHLIGMAVELGLPGLGIYLAMLLVIFRRLYVLADAIPDGVFLNVNFVLLLAVGLFMTLLNNVFVEPSLHLFAQLNFFVLAGIADQLYNKYARWPCLPASTSGIRTARAH